MSFENTLFIDLVIAIAAAFAGGLVATTFRLPLLLGYLAAGVIVGPHLVGVVTTVDEVRELAEFGVVLLLFAVGVEISLKDLQKFGRSVIAIGFGQVGLTIAAGAGVGTLLGWTWEQSLILGLVVSLSSTMVVLKALVDRDELRSFHGRLLTGVMLVQDLAFVIMIAVLPALGEGGDFSVRELGEGLLKAFGVMAAMLILGPRLFPSILRRIAIVQQRELFLLSLMTITFGIAVITQEIGLSAAVGAFLAGLALSESDFGHRAMSETVPLRHVFGALFFVSLGMFADPGAVADDPTTLLAIIGAVIGVKFVVGAGITWVTGHMPHIAVMVGLGLVQIGEFSFVLADQAARLGIVGEEFLSVTVMAAVITMALTPAVLTAGSRALDALGRPFPALRPFRTPADEEQARLRGMQSHAVVAGLGRVGSMVASSFHDQGIPFVGVDIDPRVCDRWQAADCDMVIGSSASPEVLDAARVKDARLLVVATGDLAAASVTVERAREMNPALDIVVRAHWQEDGERLRGLGVNEVVWPENEAGLEIIRHSLLRFQGVPREVETIVEELREEAITPRDDDEDEFDRLQGG